MTTIVEAPEVDIFEKVKGKALASVKDVLTDAYSADRADLAEDLAEALGLDDVEDLPKFSVEIVLRVGKQTISVSGFERDEGARDEPLF